MDTHQDVLRLAEDIALDHLGLAEQANRVHVGT